MSYPPPHYPPASYSERSWDENALGHHPSEYHGSYASPVTIEPYHAPEVPRGLTPYSSGEFSEYSQGYAPQRNHPANYRPYSSYYHQPPQYDSWLEPIEPNTSFPNRLYGPINHPPHPAPFLDPYAPPLYPYSPPPQQRPPLAPQHPPPPLARRHASSRSVSPLQTVDPLEYYHNVAASRDYNKTRSDERLLEEAMRKSLQDEAERQRLRQLEQIAIQSVNDEVLSKALEQSLLESLQVKPSAELDLKQLKSDQIALADEQALTEAICASLKAAEESSTRFDSSPSGSLADVDALEMGIELSKIEPRSKPVSTWYLDRIRDNISSNASQYSIPSISTLTSNSHTTQGLSAERNSRA